MCSALDRGNAWGGGSVGFFLQFMLKSREGNKVPGSDIGTAPSDDNNEGAVRAVPSPMGDGMFCSVIVAGGVKT